MPKYTTKLHEVESQKTVIPNCTFVCMISGFRREVAENCA